MGQRQRSAENSRSAIVHALVTLSGEEEDRGCSVTSSRRQGGGGVGGGCSGQDEWLGGTVSRFERSRYCDATEVEAKGTSRRVRKLRPMKVSNDLRPAVEASKHTQARHAWPLSVLLSQGGALEPAVPTKKSRNASFTAPCITCGESKQANQAGSQPAGSHFHVFRTSHRPTATVGVIT